MLYFKAMPEDAPRLASAGLQVRGPFCAMSLPTSLAYPCCPKRAGLAQRNLHYSLHRAADLLYVPMHMPQANAKHVLFSKQQFHIHEEAVHCVLPTVQALRCDQALFLVLIMVEQRSLWRRSRAGLDIDGGSGGAGGSANGLAEPLLAGAAADAGAKP